MRVLMISTDRKILEEGSAVRARMIEYGGLVEELHIVIPAYNLQLTTYDKKIKISKNIFTYPAVASNKIFALWKAYRIGIGIFTRNSELGTRNCLVTSQDPFETGFSARYISRKIGAKLELQIHTDFLNPYFAKESFLNKIRVVLARFLLPRADGIRVVSERIASSLKANSYKLKAAPTILPIFVDIEKIKNTLPSADLHKKYPQFDFIILMASRLTKEKNIGLAIKVMKSVAGEHPKAGLVIVGSGPEEKNLKLRTQNLELSNNVVFEEWNDDVISYMKTADCFLLTSNYEGFGLSLVEAAASGCPIITTDVGIAGDTLKSENDLLVCRVDDRLCVVKCLEKIFSSASLRKKLSASAVGSVGILNTTKERYLASIQASWEKCFQSDILKTNKINETADTHPKSRLE